MPSLNLASNNYYDLHTSMQTHDFFLILLIILLAARVFAELANYLNLPSVIGELIAGIILGPSLLGWVEPIEAIKFMAEIGIILLLFEGKIQKFT